MTAWRRLVAAAVALSGLLTLSSAASPNLPWRQHALVRVEPGRAIALGHVLAGVVGVALVWLAIGLARGKRRAVTGTIVLLLAATVLNLAKGLDYEEAGVALALAVILLRGRRAFVRGGDRPRGAVVAAVVALGAVAAAYLLLTLGMARHGLGTGAWWMHSDTALAVALDALTLVALAAALLLVRAVLRPAAGSDGHTPASHARAADIVARYGSDSLAPFVLREDKAFFFASGGVLAYRTLRETAVVSSDPIGPPGEAAEILREFMAFADARGWNVVVTAASESAAREYRERLGLRTMPIGNEAVVDPQSFTLEGRAVRKVRQSVSRVERHGWTIESALSRDLSGEMVAEIQRVQDGWAEARGSLTGFAMSLARLWGAAEDADCLYVLARDPGGRVAGFLHFLPYAGGLSLDAMRRLGDEPNGLNEAMVVRALQYAREHGMREVSLNFAGLAHVMAADAPLTLRWRLLRLLVRAVHNRFQLERLVRFNDKFFPAWRPRFLVYRTRAELPLAALRVLQAEAYVRPPRGRLLAARWRPLPHPLPLREGVTLGAVRS